MINQKYPFFTVGKHANEEFIGIIQNSSKNMISMYAFNLIKEETVKESFILLGEEWWWSSNRTVPIDIFLKPDFDKFKPYLRHFTTKEFVVLSGPIISLSNLTKKRVKKRTIELVKSDKK